MAALQITTNSTGTAAASAVVTHSKAGAFERDAAQVQQTRSQVQTAPQTQVQLAQQAQQTSQRTAQQSGRTVEAGTSQRELVSVSEDGDTFAVSRSGQQDLMDSRAGSVTAIPSDRTAAQTEAEASQLRTAEEAQQRAMDARIQAASTAEESAEAEMITDFSGIPTARLETLYAEGRISQTDYDQEIERRAELLAEETDGALSFSTIAVGVHSLQTKSDMMQSAIAASTGETGSDGLRGSERLDAAIQLEHVEQRQLQQENIQSEEQQQWRYLLQA